MSEEVVMSEVIADEKAPVITMRKLLEAGVHFGHQTRRWNPKMKPYVYTARNGIYIIDLNKTVESIQNAYDALKKIVDEGGKVLFVGTKKQCQEIVKEEALRSGSFYATNRWLGGTLTNFRTIQKRIKRLKDIETMQEDGTFDALPKKEVALIKKEAEKGYYSYSVPYQFTIQKEFSYVEKILEKDGFDISYEYDFEDGYEYWEISWK